MQEPWVVIPLIVSHNQKAILLHFLPLIAIGHSEDKIIAYFENEARPGVLQSRVQQTCTLQEFQIIRAESKHSVWSTLYSVGILAVDTC